MPVSSVFHCTAMPQLRRCSPMIRSLSSWPSIRTKGNGLMLFPMSPSGMRAVHFPSAHILAPLLRGPGMPVHDHGAHAAPSELVGEHQSGGAASHDQYVRIHVGRGPADYI